MESKLKRAHILISGQVQGVGFRWWVQQQAQGLQLFGWVKNLDDGRVEAVAEGEKKQADKLIKLLKKGPIFSKVENVEVGWEKVVGEFKNFQIVS